MIRRAPCRRCRITARSSSSYARAARLLGDDKSLDLPDVGVAGEGRGIAQPDVADEDAVEFGDVVVPGAEPLVVEGVDGRLGARHDGVLGRPGDTVETAERVLVVEGGDAYVRYRHEGHFTGGPAQFRQLPGRARQDGRMNDSPLAPDSRRSRVAIAGASGLIGSALTRSLTADGHEVVRLVRRAPRGKDEVRWDPDGQRMDAAGSAVRGGRQSRGLVASQRWTEAYKRKILDSRVRGTATLATAVASLDERPRVFVNGSAIGFYGETGDRVVDESAPPGRDSFPPCAWRGGGGGTGAGGGVSVPSSPVRGWWWPVRAGRGEALSALQSGARWADGGRPPVLELHLPA